MKTFGKVSFIACVGCFFMASTYAYILLADNPSVPQYNKVARLVLPILEHKTIDEVKTMYNQVHAYEKTYVGNNDRVKKTLMILKEMLDYPEVSCENISQENFVNIQGILENEEEKSPRGSFVSAEGIIDYRGDRVFVQFPGFEEMGPYARVAHPKTNNNGSYYVAVELIGGGWGLVHNSSFYGGLFSAALVPHFLDNGSIVYSANNKFYIDDVEQKFPYDSYGITTIPSQLESSLWSFNTTKPSFLSYIPGRYEGEIAVISDLSVPLLTLGYIKEAHAVGKDFLVVGSDNRDFDNKTGTCFVLQNNKLQAIYDCFSVGNYTRKIIPSPSLKHTVYIASGEDDGTEILVDSKHIGLIFADGGSEEIPFSQGGETHTTKWVDVRELQFTDDEHFVFSLLKKDDVSVYKKCTIS